MKKWCTALAIAWYVFWLIAPIEFFMIDYTFQNIIMPQSYISVIDTPTYSNKWTRDVLNEFNAMADGGAVNFFPQFIKIPINIVEKEDLDEVPYYLRETVTLGEANYDISHCTISLKTKLDYAKFRKVLIHEYLHCMGYDHIENKPTDLMSPMLGDIPEENIRGYAKKVAKKIWKSSKN